MSTLDAGALVGAAGITIAFFLGRWGELVFVGSSLLVLVGSAVAAVSSAGPAGERLLLVAGLALYFLGLAIVRVMAHRSVSLRMLERYAGGGDEGGVEEIRGRLVDVERYRLASTSEAGLRLTAAGRLVAVFLATIYRFGRVEA